jgi:hypothetical protein
MKALTDRSIKALKPAPVGTRYERMDSLIRAFGVRVTDKGQKTFILKTRFPGSQNQTRRAIGEYPAMTLDEARTKAGEWRKLIKRGQDPSIIEARERNAAVTQQQNTFGAVAEDFIDHKIKSERRGKDAKRDLEREFIPKWKRLPITEITEDDVLSIINVKKRTAPAQARNLLALIKRFFSWAIDQRVYGLKISPAAGLKPRKVITARKGRGNRILSDDELFAFWRATERLRYPAGPAYQLLALAALRLNESVRTKKPEIDRRNSAWVIPAERMKARDEVALPHAVPLTSEIMGVFDSLPAFNSGQYVFSTTAGAKAVWLGDKIKKKIDARMLLTLRALARLRGQEPVQVELKPWVNHDIRRTVRTNLSRLRVSEEAREAVLAHVRPGIKGTYDLYDYFDEKREALEMWAARLRAIIWAPYREMRPAIRANVITLRA